MYLITQANLANAQGCQSNFLWSCVLKYKLFIIVLLTGCGGSGDPVTSADTGGSTPIGIGFNTGSPTRFGRLPAELTFGGSSSSDEGVVVTSGVSHSLASWIGKDLLCNGRNNYAQLDDGLPELRRFESDGRHLNRSKRVVQTCDVNAISDPNVCWSEEIDFDDSFTATWIFNLIGVDGGTVQAIYMGFPNNDNGISYQQGMIEYEGNLVALQDAGKELCVLLENGTTGISDR